MDAQALTDATLRGYLLGSLAPEFRSTIEAHLFSRDEVLWERLCIVEEDLIDDFLAGTLAEQDRTRFENHFLCTHERREKLEFARALKAYADQQPRRTAASQWLLQSVRVPRWAVAATAFVIVALSPVLWQLSTIDDTEEVVASLHPGRLRGQGQIPRVIVTPRTQLVRLHLDAGDEQYDTYQMTLHEVSGQEVSSQRKQGAALADGRTTVTLTLPVDALASGDYYVQLYGELPPKERVPLGRYDVRVLRQ